MMGTVARAGIEQGKGRLSALELKKLEPGMHGDGHGLYLRKNIGLGWAHNQDHFLL